MPSVPQAERLLERAQKGEKLPTKERRHVVAYAMATGLDATTEQLAEWFQVSERAIFLDRKWIREEKARLIKDDDIGLVISDIVLTYDKEIRDIERSKQRCKCGTKDFLMHCKTLFDMQMKKVEALQALGYYPKNLGSMTVEKFEYSAVVSKDGTVDTRRTADIFDKEITDAEFTELPAKQLQAPEVTDDAPRTDDSWLDTPTSTA